MLLAARRRLDQMKMAVLSHFAKEENILFPAFAALADARRHQAGPPRLPFPSVLHPIRAMEVEHDRAERELTWLQTFARAFEPTPGSGEAWRDFRHALTRFADELRSHARFENDLLFPRALDVERSLL